MNGSVSLGELLNDEKGNIVRITFTKEEKKAINKYRMTLLKIRYLMISMK